MYEVKLKSHPSANCHVEIEGSTITLVSYVTKVLKAEKDENGDYFLLPMGAYWDGYRVYTPTTARHISNFLAEFFPGTRYQEVKEAVVDGNLISAELSGDKEWLIQM